MAKKLANLAGAIVAGLVMGGLALIVLLLLVHAIVFLASAL